MNEARIKAAFDAMRANAELWVEIERRISAFFAVHSALERNGESERILAVLYFEQLSSEADSQSAEGINQETQKVA